MTGTASMMSGRPEVSIPIEKLLPLASRSAPVGLAVAYRYSRP
jgi:hypothetical protein